MRLLPLAATVILLAGCLEERPAPSGGQLAPTLDEPLLRLTPTPLVTPTIPTIPSAPTPTPTPPAPPEERPPAGERTTLHRDTQAPDDPDVVRFDVPARATRLEVTLGANRSMAYATLRAPGGVGAGACAPPCALRVEAPEAGSWSIELPSGREDEIHVDATAWIVQAPTSEKSVAYEAEQAFAGRTNRTDVFLVLAGHERLEGAIRLDVVDVDPSWPAVVLLVAPDGELVARCEGGECAVSRESPAPGRWRVAYEGTANGTARVALALAGAGVEPAERVILLDSEHAYASWGDRRGAFGEGAWVPGWASRVEFTMEFAGDADPASTAKMAVWRTGQTTGVECAREQGSCSGESRLVEGLWNARWEGVDAAAGGRIRIWLLP